MIEENTIDYNAEKNLIIIKIKWTHENISILRNIPTSKYNTETKEWTICGDFARFINSEFSTLDKTTAFINKIADIEKHTTELSDFNSEIEKAVDFSQPFGKRTLFKHQVEGVKHILKNEKSIVAADLGTGKTTMALVAMNLTKLPIHVIAPVSLHDNWKREAQELNVNITKILSSSNIPQPPNDPMCLIVDEAHYFQNEGANRTKNFLNYCSNATFLALLSGTPIKNGRPENIFPLLTAIRHPIAANKDFFYKRYCKAERNRWRKRVTKGGANLTELHTIISGKMFVKKKSECLDLPAKSRILTIAEPSDQEQGMFDLVFKSLQERYYDRVKTGKIKENNEALVILSQIRHAASWAKVSTTKRLVEELVKEERPAVVFLNYKDSATALKGELDEICPTALLTSDVSAGNRDALVQDFQKGIYKAIICTYGTGGVGITLTASSDIILTDRPWTPGEAVQAEDRVHRIGTVNPVTAIWIQQHEIDKKIDKLLIEKQMNVSEVVSGTRDTLEFADTIEAQAEQILSEIF